ncbi:hypothetical protein VUJ46_19500 [Chryseobacterium sp. MYb264]|uniref:hypothetical protein n=1 Tax=Chryseobacterium sp. MYb264 TaxID=2745153 RepID=UPI002E1657A4|nr:hypothetical protein VUJ46_19500 [Chryseobacterium sp. MYb264]
MEAVIRKSLQIIFILCSGIIICQDKELKEIDDLLKKTFQYRSEYNTIEALKQAKLANILALQSKNSERIAKSCYEIALLTITPELQKQSLLYIGKAEAESYTRKNIPFQARIKEVKYYNYALLGLRTQSMKELFGAQKLLEHRNDSESRQAITSIYGNIGNYYLENGKPDSAQYYYAKIYGIIKDLPEKYRVIRIPEYYGNMGEVYRIKKKQDSTLYYFQKAYQLKIKNRNSSVFLELMALGDYYSDKNDHAKALDYYLRSLHNMKENHTNIDPFLYIYQDIAAQYGLLGDKKLHTAYKKMYTNQQIANAELSSRNAELALEILLKDNETQFRESQKKNYLLIIAFVAILFLSLLSIYRVLRKRIKERESMIFNVTNTLQEKEKAISEKSIEAKELQQKINHSYQDLVHLAKINAPNFYQQFKELYPEFENKLKDLQPNLRISELILCAYTYLGFNIKDIADYTLKSVHTVRNRKQNLRKKFGVPTDQDFGVWMRNLADNK